MSMLVTEDNNNNNNNKPHVVVDVDNNVSQGSTSSCVGNEGCASSETSEEQQQSNSHDSGSEIVAGAIEKERGSSVSSDQCSVELVDLESDVDKVRHLDHDNNNNNKVERDCRICHLSMDMTNHESGGSPIELGCSCKDDLAAAHKQCAEAWFKIKGNKTCEICGSIAHNVAGTIEVQMTEQWNDSNDASMAPPTGPAPPAGETRNFWQGHRFLNFLLACMVFAFVISWLFHFNVPS